MVSDAVRAFLFVALSSCPIAMVGCDKRADPTPAASSVPADAKDSAPMTSPEPTATVPHGVLWEIGKPETESNQFDTDPHDDPEVVEYKIGEPADKFPEGLGTDIGKQRSTIRIHFTSAISPGTELHVRWNPGGSESVDKFRVELDGKAIGESPAIMGTQPEKWRTDTFSVPASEAKDHVLVFSHLQGDGLGLAHIQLETK